MARVEELSALDIINSAEAEQVESSFARGPCFLSSALAILHEPRIAVRFYPSGLSLEAECEPALTQERVRAGLRFARLKGKELRRPCAA